MPARLPCAQHAFRAACEPALAIRSCRPAVITRSQPQAQAQAQSRIQTQPIPGLSWQQQQHRPSSSSSSTRWKSRQQSDTYTKSSKLTALKSRAAYKLLEINDKHKLFRAGQSVVDLGYAPGSWSQVAKNRVGESGRVVGIDVIPAQPPRGVSALQGDFLSEGVQGLVREFVREWKMGEVGVGEEGEEDGNVKSVVEQARGSHAAVAAGEGGEEGSSTLAAKIVEDASTSTEESAEAEAEAVSVTTVEKKKTTKKAKKLSPAALDLQQGRVVDVVLSDMCAPFPGLELSSWVNSVNRPYRRMMNTSGNPFRDHAGSIVRFVAFSSSERERIFGANKPFL